MKKATKLSFLIILSLYLSACSAGKPKWTKNYPIEEGYWVGIARELKEGNGNYSEKAKQKALADIASNISIAIQSQTTQSLFEEDYQVSEKFRNDISAEVSANLRGYELVASWQNKKEYWVYYRLSKAKWKQLEKERIEALIKRALVFYNKGIEEKDNNNLAPSLRYFSQAFAVLQHNLHEDLTAFVHESGSVDLPSEIVRQINITLNSLDFVAVDPYEIDEKGKELVITIKNRSNGKIVKNFPTKFSNQRSIEKSFQSDYEGKVKIHSDQLILTSGNSQFEIMADIDALLGVKDGKNVLREILDSKSIYPSKSIRAFYTKPTAYLIYDSKTELTDFVVEELKGLFSKNYFDFTDNRSDAHYILIFNTEYRSGEYVEKYDLYAIFLNANISITRVEDNKELYFFSYDNIKGLKKGGEDKALRDAFNKLEEQLIDDFHRKVKF